MDGKVKPPWMGLRRLLKDGQLFSIRAINSGPNRHNLRTDIYFKIKQLMAAIQDLRVSEKNYIPI